MNVGSWREIDVTARNTCDLDRAAIVDGKTGYALVVCDQGYTSPYKWCHV